MTGKELRRIREAVGLKVVEFGRALGFAGEDHTVWVAVNRLETEARKIRVGTARLARMFEQDGVPEPWMFRTHEGKDRV